MKLKITLAACLVGFLLTVAATSVLGHAELESSDPADGATIKTPYTLTATFDEELTPDGSSIKVEDSSGKQVATGTVSETDDKSMTADLPALPDGEYEVLWTAVTADDLAVERGTYHFNVAAEAPSVAATAKPTAAATSGPTSGAQTPAASGAPSPQPSASSGTATGGGNDLAIALVLAAIIIAAVVGFVLYRNRS